MRLLARPPIDALPSGGNDRKNISGSSEARTGFVPTMPRSKEQLHRPPAPRGMSFAFAQFQIDYVYFFYRL